MGRWSAAAVAAALLMAAPSAGHAQTYWGQTSSGTAGTATPQATCDAAVQQRMDGQQRYMVDSFSSLARQMYPDMPPGGFTGMSCLDRLLSSSLNILFSPPSLGDILAMIVNGLCQFATSFAQQEVSSLSQSISASVPLGQVIPGVNLGSLGFGATMSPTIGGGSGSGLVNVNGSGLSSGSYGGGLVSVGGSSSSQYWGGAYGTQQYGSMFGPGSYGGFSQSATGSGGWFSSFFGK